MEMTSADKGMEVHSVRGGDRSSRFLRGGLDGTLDADISHLQVEAVRARAHGLSASRCDICRLWVRPERPLVGTTSRLGQPWSFVSTRNNLQLPLCSMAAQGAWFSLTASVPWLRARTRLSTRLQSPSFSR